MMNRISYLLFLFIGFYIPSGISQVLERQIESSSDDAEERFDGTYVTTSSSDIELVYDSWNNQGNQTVGFRFDDIVLPANSIVNNAYIQFTADGSYSGDLTMTIRGDKTANSPTFTTANYNISNRPTTAASVVWNDIPNWSGEQAGVAQRTPDLSAIVTEIMELSDWGNGNAITFIIEGDGNEDARRRAYSYDENPMKSAKLVIEYTSSSAVDMSVTAIHSPHNYNYPNTNIPVAIEILNYGNTTALDYEVSYAVNGEVIATEPGIDSLEQGESTVFTFTQTADLSVEGEYEITAEISIINDEDSLNNTAAKTCIVLSEVDTLFFDEGSDWRYWDSSLNPGDTWNMPAFNDSTWLAGVGRMGFGNGDEQTLLNNGIVNYYFRKKVDIADISSLEEIYIHMVHDDAAILYINGQEAFRSELMPLGAITHGIPARQSNNSSTEDQFYTYKVDPTLFVSGVNTIAVSLHNRSASNDDLSFDCFITPHFVYDQDGPYVYYQGDSVVVEEVTPDGIVSNTYASTEGLELTCTLPHMGTSFSFPIKQEITIEPSEYDNMPPKFLAVSDFDGHIEAFTMLLRGEGIIDEDFNWIYGNGHLIISGDLFDRGFHITECMWLLYKLEAEAEAQGGKVHLVIGNHEMFNLTDDWRYVEVKYFNNAHLKGKRMAQLYDEDTELGRWLRSKNIIERIGDYAFMHGGISANVAALGLSFDEMNDFGRLEMDGTCIGALCNIVNGSNGLYWYRGMVDEELTQQQVDEFVTGFGVERIIVGHTKGSTVRSLYNGRVLAIDMYHIDNFEDGYMEALQFELGCFYIFHTEGDTQSYTLLDECDDYTNVIEINQQGQLQIYPNPTVNLLNIKLPLSMVERYNYSIVDSQGKLLKQGFIEDELSSISLAGFSAGKYFLVLDNGKSKITGHFLLIQH